LVEEGLELTLRPYASGFTKPVDIRAFTGGRLLVVQQEGLVVLAGATTPAAPFLDLRGRVSCCVEQGLLSLSLHPEFARNGQFFVYYTDLSGNGVLSRFKLKAGRAVADPASEEVVLQVPQPGTTHNGGQLQFGPDGYLYLSLGDGEYRPWEQGVKLYAQDESLLLGKLLRLDIDKATPYAIPWDNPLSGKARVRQEIWLRGLRNPWRFSFDSATGDLWMGDVGQNFYEKVIFQPASSDGGENYGWPILGERACLKDNSCELEGFSRPAIVYSRQDGCAVTGGYVYRGEALRALQGHYLYGDFCTGRIWAAQQTEGGWEAVALLDTEITLSTFGEDNQGELYVADYAGGSLYKLTAKAGLAARAAD
jgi:glucose/arabinose dehydrogenase